MITACPAIVNTSGKIVTKSSTSLANLETQLYTPSTLTVLEILLGEFPLVKVEGVEN